MLKHTRRFLWLTLGLTILFAGISLGQGPLTNAMNLMVRATDGNLFVYGVPTGAQGPLTNFGNIRLRTYNGGDLGVVINGGTITPNNVTCSQNGIAATSTDCFVAQNTTAATVGTQTQYSPRLRFCGTAWKTDVTTASQVDCDLIELRTLAAAGATTSSLAIASSINGGAYTDVLTVSSAGELVTGGRIVVGSNLVNSTTGSIGWNLRTALTSPADAQLTLTNAAASSGFGLQGGTDDTMIVANRAQNAYGTVDALAYKLSAKLTFSTTAPTISGFAGSSPSATVTAGSNTAAFRIGVGGTAPGTTGTITLPTASTGWNCWVVDQTTPLDITRQTSSTTTSVVITSTIAWTANDILVGGCAAF